MNVGCIPKKLMHQACLLGESMEDAREFGWSVSEKKEHDWVKMREGIQDYISMLNFRYRTELRFCIPHFFPSVPDLLTRPMLAASIFSVLLPSSRSLPRPLDEADSVRGRTKQVTYFNSLAKFVDDHTVELTDKKGNVERKTAANIIVATGGRPRYLGLPNER